MSDKHAGNIAIIDDLYPHPACIDTWRGVEFQAYIDHFEDVMIYSNMYSRHLVDTMTEEDILRSFMADHPEYYPHVRQIDGWDIPKHARPDLFYSIFLNNAYSSLPCFEHKRRPFIFELYPGGGFCLDDADSDRKLQTLMRSRHFQGVVVTSRVTQDYLLEKGLCPVEKMLPLWGGVLKEGSLAPSSYRKRRFGFEKETVDIAFIASRYTEHGEDKGYDIFIEVARELSRRFPNMRYHVVGNFDETVIDVSELGDSIRFYGRMLISEFDDFFIDKDILLSPNRMDTLASGAFDGFPTGCACEALARKTAVFCTDSLRGGQNGGQYEPGDEIEIVTTEVGEIVETIAQAIGNPDKLKRMGEAGTHKARTLYSFDQQVKPRIAFIEKALEEVTDRKTLFGLFRRR